MFICVQMLLAIFFSVQHANCHHWQIDYTAIRWKSSLLYNFSKVELNISSIFQIHFPFSVSQVLCDFCFFHFFIMLHFVPSGPCGFSIWHWDDQTAPQVSRCWDWSDYDDFLYDWWSGEWCLLGCKLSVNKDHSWSPNQNSVHPWLVYLVRSQSVCLFSDLHTIFSDGGSGWHWRLIAFH